MDCGSYAQLESLIMFLIARPGRPSHGRTWSLDVPEKDRVIQWTATFVEPRSVVISHKESHAKKYIVVSKSGGTLIESCCTEEDSLGEALDFIQDIFSSEYDPPAFIECFSVDEAGKLVDSYPVKRTVWFGKPEAIEEGDEWFLNLLEEHNGIEEDEEEED